MAKIEVKRTKWSLSNVYKYFHNNYLRVFVILIFLVLMCGYTSQQPAAYKTVTAERFLIVDNKGRPRGVFGMIDDDCPNLSLADESGKPRVSITIQNGESVISVLDKMGNRKAGLKTSASATTFFIKDSNIDVMSITNINGKTTQVIKDNKGAVRLVFELTENESSIFLRDKNETPHIVLTTADYGPIWPAPKEVANGPLSSDIKSQKKYQRESKGDGNWQVIKKWNGQGIKKTESFTTKTREWRIRWNCQADTQFGSGVLQIYVYRDDGKTLWTDLIANVVNSSSDISYVRTEPGRYYLDINSVMMKWEIIVEERR